VQRPAITKHLKNIFDSGELVEYSVSSILEHTAADGKNYKTKFYNLDAIISVGYRVNSTQATHFRIWATERLREYIIKGFTMDDERLKNPNTIFGKDFFEEQLARIRDIRSSERRFYQKITDIYSQCSADGAGGAQRTAEHCRREQGIGNVEPDGIATGERCTRQPGRTAVGLRRFSPSARSAGLGER